MCAFSARFSCVLIVLGLAALDGCSDHPGAVGDGGRSPEPADAEQPVPSPQPADAGEAAEAGAEADSSPGAPEDAGGPQDSSEPLDSPPTSDAIGNDGATADSNPATDPADTQTEPAVDAEDADEGTSFVPSEDAPASDLAEEPPGEPEPCNPSPIGELAVVENPDNALSLFAFWETSEPTQTSLHVDCGSDYRGAIAGSGLRTSHAGFVMGLWQGADCRLEATGTIDGVACSSGADVIVGDPPLWLPSFSVDVIDTDAMHPGWTVLNLNNRNDGLPLVVAIIDELGRYRWYHVRAGDHYGSDNVVHVLDDGLLIGGGGGNQAAIVDWEGQLLWEAPFYNHHDLVYQQAADQLLYLGKTDACPGDVTEGTVNVWSFEEEETTWTWSICEHYTPPEIEDDWSHLNTIEVFPDDRLLISSRDQHALFLIDRNTGDTVWTLGQVGDFALILESEDDPDPNFYRQHAPELQPDGNLLMFDNGASDIRPYSRAVEIAYDEETMTAWAVWEWAPDPPIFTPIWGDADRLPNGNTLVTFGSQGVDPNTRLFEVTREGEVVWEVSLPHAWGIYRSDRVTDLPVGHSLEAP